MKIKQFTAPNMSQAITQIRSELGEDAIIVATEENGTEVTVTAAVESFQELDFDKNDQLEVSPSLQVYDDTKIRESLEYHDVLPDIAGQLLAIARQQYLQKNKGDNQELLAFALEKIYKFASLWDKKQKNKIFLGIPGCGKSTVIAKIATKAKIKKLNPVIISADYVRAGANGQLQAFAKILQTDYYFCKNAKELFNCVQQGQTKYDMLLIDTPGINPYENTQITMVDELIDSLKADKILVQDAGRNTLEATETAEIFGQIGANMLLPTHLDMTRRIGSVISSAYCNRLSFCAGSVSSDIAKGFADVTSSALAKLLLTE